MAGYRNQVSRAIAALLELQNSDGGFPATQRGHPSGCWTTADVLEALLVVGAIGDVHKSNLDAAIRFLLNSILEVRSGVWGWPLFKGTTCSILATGHVTAALMLAARHYAGTSLEREMNVAIKKGLACIQASQNSDGGWGPFPFDTEVGAESRVVATFYACLPYFYTERSDARPTLVRRAVSAIRDAQKADGSWGNGVGGPSSVSDTARSITFLSRFGSGEGDLICVSKGVRFLENARRQDGTLWDIDTEAVFEPGASAQLVINKNTICDVIVALSSCDQSHELLRETLKWALSSQSSSGLWPLSAPRQLREDITVWSTAEWITSIDAAFKNVSLENIAATYTLSQNQKRYRFGFYIAVIFWLFSIDKIGAFLEFWIGKIPGGVWTLIGVSILLAGVVNVVSNSIYDKLKAQATLRKQKRSTSNRIR